MIKKKKNNFKYSNIPTRVVGAASGFAFSP